MGLLMAKAPGRAPQRLPARCELHSLSTVPSRSQGLQHKELEPDQTQPENTNTYGEVPRAFPRKRLLWKRRWRGPADLAGRRQWDCGGRCCSTSSPRLPAAGRAPASLTQPRLCPLLHFCSQAVHVCCLQTGLGGDAPLGAGSRESSPGTALAWWAQLHWDQWHQDWPGTWGMVKTRLAPALHISLEQLQEQVQVPQPHRSANSLQQGPGPGFAQRGLHDPYGRKQTLHYGGDPTGFPGQPQLLQHHPSLQGEAAAAAWRLPWPEGDGGDRLPQGRHCCTLLQARGETLHVSLGCPFLQEEGRSWSCARHWKYS